MYSGITQGLFPVIAIIKKNSGYHYTIELSDHLAHGLTIGNSVNIDGVCQTLVHIQNNRASFEATTETLRLTTLSELTVGRKVSVERSLKCGDEMGGHCIYGHVIGCASVVQRAESSEQTKLTLQCPPTWMKYILHKGFVAVDGSSLTVSNPSPQGQFDIHLIAETLRLTNFANKGVGKKVNIELDANTHTIVTTVERYLQNN